MEIAEFVNATTVEKVYAIIKKASRSDSNALAQTGWRCATTPNDADLSRLKLALEKGAEVMHRMAEEQRGRTSRSLDNVPAEQVWPTEASLFREAFVTLDKGTPVENLVWIYTAGSILAGLIPLSSVPREYCN